MNAFYEHHQDSIKFSYRCFDRILLNGLIQPFQQPKRVVGFFNHYRSGCLVNKRLLSSIADDYHTWILQQAARWRVPILEDSKDRRDELVEPYFRKAQPDDVVAIIKAREPSRILKALGPADTPYLEYAQRWVIHYNIYVNDSSWGKMFVRMCPYLPFSARICLNQHNWLANRMHQDGVDFRRCTNAFLECSDPQRLQQLADSLTAADLQTCGYRWLTEFTPFFSPWEWKHANCVHRLFFSQVEYCDNLIFHQRAAVDALEQRLLDANRSIGKPDNLLTIFGRRVTSHHRGKLQTEIEDLHLENPVIRSYYGHGFAKQYVRDTSLLRTEPATNDVRDYGVNKSVENLPELRQKMGHIIDSYLDVQQDILETFVDRGQLRHLLEPTLSSSGKRIPGLKLDHPRQLALMHGLVSFAHIAAGGTFTAADLLPQIRTTLGVQPDAYSPGSLRYDLSKLRAKGLVEKVPHSHRYRLAPKGYAICVVFLKLFERIYAPLTAGILRPIKGDSRLPSNRRHSLDRLYQTVVDDLDRLMQEVGIKIAA
jgi:hypothetical protein